MLYVTSLSSSGFLVGLIDLRFGFGGTMAYGISQRIGGVTQIDQEKTENRYHDICLLSLCLVESVTAKE